MSIRRDERGSATAEFAIVVPAALLVVLLAVASLAAAGTQVRLEHAAAQAARLAARGEDAARAHATVTAAVPGASLSLGDDGDLVCAAVSADHGVPLPLPPLRARACALAGDLS
ncbi:TadE family type IV pilus minor pilin [Microbacterium thalli]|uniref:TadE family type IV pilus minor pilin n=1 Tax=Microbacterium thalli TaxID=3027921 RepID=A0ABT5SGA4_9MICO|nr:TadE family type IV pilus minor pilin [Microbacterium thalli]MDD7929226.1 TadE family type IV pilus minor pilin [Microbacterium thalli]MDD7961810.1 TadE family type IV pilus minor pilin [Microbacterium thalli]MDN8549212.1 TadE family type IV pilus minor pilin [Microbacterium thalli]